MAVRVDEARGDGEPRGVDDALAGTRLEAIRDRDDRVALDAQRSAPCGRAGAVDDTAALDEQGCRRLGRWA